MRGSVGRTAALRRHGAWLVGLAGAALALAAAGPAAQPKPRLVVLATGGTIAGSAKSETDAGYKAGALAVDVLIEAVPQAREIATLRGEQVASIGSQDMNDEVWVKLARRANELLAAPDVDGVVVTHGTDTLEETSYFLHLVLKSDKPVVMTGSMRPATAMSADGPLNIYNAVAVAADPSSRGRGVLVVVNDDIHSAHDVVKTHTTDVQTFSSGEPGLVGVTLFGRQEFYRAPSAPHTTTSELALPADGKLPRVDIVYAHAGMSPDLIDAAVANGARGIVVAGVGDGNMTAPALEAVRRAVTKGVAVVRASRVGQGIVRRNVEVDDDALGTIASMELHPAKARVLLKLALLKTSERAALQRYFDRY
ncbi:MAG: type II asparaginase [Acidobacteria bacterium]|nr:type II asparaginase [Acidobacteriota bacterium]